MIGDEDLGSAPVSAELGIVVIGRNEGERLVACLASLPIGAFPRRLRGFRLDGQQRAGRARPGPCRRPARCGPTVLGGAGAERRGEISAHPPSGAALHQIHRRRLRAARRLARQGDRLHGAAREYRHRLRPAAGTTPFRFGVQFPLRPRMGHAGWPGVDLRRRLSGASGRVPVRRRVRRKPDGGRRARVVRSASRRWVDNLAPRCGDDASRRGHDSLWSMVAPERPRRFCDVAGICAVLARCDRDLAKIARQRAVLGIAGAGVPACCRPLAARRSAWASSSILHKSLGLRSGGA